MRIFSFIIMLGGLLWGSLGIMNVILMSLNGAPLGLLLLASIGNLIIFVVPGFLWAAVAGEMLKFGDIFKGGGKWA